jgi:hypothetical protein
LDIRGLNDHSDHYLLWRVLMTDGRLQIINASGAVQLDTNYQSLHMIQSATVTTPWFVDKGLSGPLPVALTANAPIVAWGATGYYNMCNVFANPGGGATSWSFQPWAVDATGANAPNETTTGVPFTYYAFDTGAIPPFTGAPGTNAGIELFDASSNLLWNSLTKPIRIIGVASGTTASVTGGSYVFPSGRTYAAVITQQPVVYNATAGAPTTDAIFVNVTSTGFNIIRKPFGLATSGTFATKDFCEVVFLDVTNY